MFGFYFWITTKSLLTCENWYKYQGTGEFGMKVQIDVAQQKIPPKQERILCFLFSYVSNLSR